LEYPGEYRLEAFLRENPEYPREDNLEAFHMLGCPGEAFLEAFLWEYS
jgi:hypothetical protein